MKIYNKPELNVEAFDVEEVITQSSNIESDDVGTMSASMEFSVAANANDEF